MKQGIHPQWYNEAAVTCACGNTFKTGSTLAELEVDICSACHPFFTGEVKLVDTEGRVDKFLKKAKQAKQKQASKSDKKKTSQDESPEDSKSYKQILQEKRNQITGKAA